MNGRSLKKTAAAALAFALVGGAVPAVSGGSELFAAPIVADAADEVGVGTRWYIGDTIDTDAFFKVQIAVYYDVGFDQYMVDKTLQLENTTLPACLPLYVNEYLEGENGVQFTGVIAPQEVTTKDWRIIWDSESEKFNFYCYNSNAGTYDDSLFSEIAFCYNGEPSDVEGIEITGGSGTFDDPFTLAIIAPDVFTITYWLTDYWMGTGHTNRNGEYTLPEYNLPEYVSNPHEGETFKGWKVGNNIYQPGDTITVTEDTTLVAVWEKDNKVTGASVSLDGTIGVNFYSELNYDTAKAVLSGPNGDIEITDLESVKQENGQYKFSYPVYSDQAAEKVSLSFFDADGDQLDVYNSGGDLDEDKTIEFSVNDYIAGYEESENTKQNELVAALDNYCKAADNFFNGAENTVEGISGVNYNSIKGYAPTLRGNKMALLLNADTSIRIFYDGDAQQANLNYGDALLTKITKGGKSYFEIANISADKLSEEFVLVIDDDELKFSALSYSVLALKKTTDQALWDLSKALCVYADAAKAYKISL